MIEILLKFLFVLCLAITLSFAYPSPTDPYGSTVWIKGQKVDIKWIENKKTPLASTFTGITIQLMTGPDIGQIPLVTVVDKLSKNATSYSWTAPSPKELGYPSGQIYFLMFSDSKNPSYGYSWTTRFTIKEDEGSTPTQTANSTTTDSTTETTESTESTETTETDSTSEPTPEASTIISTTEESSPSEPTITPTSDNPFSSSNRLNAIGRWGILIVMISMTFLI